MGAGIFFSIGLCFLFSIPLVTAFFAKRMGRRPIVWFFIGAALPGIKCIDGAMANFGWGSTFNAGKQK